MNGQEIEQVVGETGEKHFGMSTEMGGDHQMVGVEDPFDDGERSFDQRTDPADSPVSSFIFRGDRMTPDRSFHGLVH